MIHQQKWFVLLYKDLTFYLTETYFSLLLPFHIKMDIPDEILNFLAYSSLIHGFHFQGAYNKTCKK